MRRTTLSAACAAVLCSLTLLGGCSSDDPGPSPEDPTGSATQTSDPGSATPTESGEPTVAAASGPVIDSTGATLNAPEGWELDPVTLPDTLSAEDPRPRLQTVTVIDLDSSSTPSLDDQVESARANFPGVKLERLPDVMLDGSPAYHLSGNVPGRGPYDEIATYAHGRSMLVNFMLNGVPDAERAEIVDSVVASFTWKD